jgi:hypothetical protein
MPNFGQERVVPKNHVCARGSNDRVLNVGAIRKRLHTATPTQSLLPKLPINASDASGLAAREYACWRLVFTFDSDWSQVLANRHVQVNRLTR